MESVLARMEKVANERKGAPEQLEEALQQMARLGGQYVESVKGLLANQMEQVQQQREDNKKVLQRLEEDLSELLKRE